MKALIKNWPGHPATRPTVRKVNTPGEARALSIRGRATIRIVDGVTEEYLASARKTMDAESAAQELVERTGG